MKPILYITHPFSSNEMPMKHHQHLDFPENNKQTNKKTPQTKSAASKKKGIDNSMNLVSFVFFQSKAILVPGPPGCVLRVVVKQLNTGTEHVFHLTICRMTARWTAMVHPCIKYIHVMLDAVKVSCLEQRFCFLFLFNNCFQSKSQGTAIDCKSVSNSFNMLRFDLFCSE